MFHVRNKADRTPRGIPVISNEKRMLLSKSAYSRMCAGVSRPRYLSTRQQAVNLHRDSGGIFYFYTSSRRLQIYSLPRKIRYFSEASRRLLSGDRVRSYFPEMGDIPKRPLILVRDPYKFSRLANGELVSASTLKYNALLISYNRDKDGFYVEPRSPRAFISFWNSEFLKQRKEDEEFMKRDPIYGRLTFCVGGSVYYQRFHCKFLKAEKISTTFQY